MKIKSYCGRCNAHLIFFFQWRMYFSVTVETVLHFLNLTLQNFCRCCFNCVNTFCNITAGNSPCTCKIHVLFPQGGKYMYHSFFSRFLYSSSNWIVNAFWTYTFIPDALAFSFLSRTSIQILFFCNFVFSHQPAPVVSECILLSLALTLRFDRFITFSNHTNTF